MFLAFLIVDLLVATVYYFASSWFFGYVKNGTHAEAKKCGWFLWAGFMFILANLIIFIISLLSTPKCIPIDDNNFVLKCVVHPIVLFSFGIWLGIRGTVLLPDLLNRFNEHVN